MFVNYAPYDFTHATFHLDANVVSLVYHRYFVVY